MDTKLFVQCKPSCPWRWHYFPLLKGKRDFIESTKWKRYLSTPILDIYHVVISMSFPVSLCDRSHRSRLLLLVRQNRQISYNGKFSSSRSPEKSIVYRKTYLYGHSREETIISLNYGKVRGVYSFAP